MQMDILEGLNPQQHRAVTAPGGAVLVLAGPGSGKTRVLAHRIAYLVQHKNVAPWRIMAVTFTNKAAREMRGRVEQLLGGQLDGLTIGTFHATCARILRREADHLPITAGYVIYDTKDQESVVKQALKALNIDEKRYPPRKMLNIIGRAKNELITPELFQAGTYLEEIAHRVYESYQKLLQENNALDFGDLLMQVVLLFDVQPAVLRKYQGRYRHILVDEFQDTNTVQYELVKRLAAGYGNLFCVGDEDQCLPTGTLIETANGPLPVEQVAESQSVRAAAGGGRSIISSVTRTANRPHAGKLVEIKTSRGHTLRLTPNHILFARLGASPDTHERAAHLMNDLHISSQFPHQHPKAKLSRRLVHLCFFGNSRRSRKYPWSSHRISFYHSDKAVQQKVEAVGFTVRPGRQDTWGVETYRVHYADAQAFAEKLATAAQADGIVLGACLSQDNSCSQRYDLHPASHIHPSMIVPVLTEEGQIVGDVVTEVNRPDYHGVVYDLDIQNVHNYVAGGIVVHNSIYLFRGADWRNVRRFREDYAECETILLEQNYRSTQIVLDAAQAVIKRNPYRTPKELFTQRQGGAPITVHEAYDEDEEAEFAVETIRRLTGRGEASPGDFAIMYRTNAQSRRIEEAFVRAGMSYRLVGATRFYARREVKDVIAYLRLVHNPADSVGFLRIINVPPRGIGAKTIAALQNWAARENISLAAALERVAAGEQHPFASRAAKVLTRFANLLAGWTLRRETVLVADLMDLILEQSGYQKHLRDGTPEGQDRWDNVRELRKVAGNHSDLTGFLEQVSLVSDVDNLAQEGSAPTLLTLHAAKGLEFSRVFIVGVEEKMLPHSRSLDDPEQMAEERRLFYVGLTRAKDQLYLLHCFRRSSWGDVDYARPSRFINDIPSSLIAGRGQETKSADWSWSSAGAGNPLPTPTPKIARPPSIPPARRGEALLSPRVRGDGQRPERGHSRPLQRTQFMMTAWQTEPESRAQPAAPPVPSYQTGQRVRHVAFGEGVVIEAQPADGDEIITVAFEKLGLKRLMGSMAKLDVL